MKDIVRTLASDSWRGAFLKALALGARGIFLVLVVPNLAAGELTTYVFASSVALIGATILILGLNEELPRVIAGDLVKAGSYLRWYFVLSALGATLFVLTMLFKSMNLAIVLFLTATLSVRLLGGIVRTIDVDMYERLQNLPWLFFIGVVLLLELNTALQLITTMALSLLLVQWIHVVYLLRGVAKTTTATPVAFIALVRHGFAHGRAKLLSNLYLLGLTRGPVLIPVWLGVSGALDQVAFAIAVGEVVSQFGSIPANRAYARWCRNRPQLLADWTAAVFSSALLAAGLFAIAWLGLLLVQLAGHLPPQAKSMAIQVQAMLFFALLPAFHVLRYLLWSRGILDRLITIIPAGMLALTVPIIYFLPENYWFISFALALLAGYASLALSSKKYFTEIGS